MIVVVAAAVAGAACGPRVRAAVFRHGAARPAGRRHCPSCRMRLLPAGVGRHWAGLSWTGRCPGCARRIGPAPASVELATAGVFAVLAGRVHDLPLLVTLCGLAGPAIALAVIDARVRRLPDALTVPAGSALCAGLAVTAAVDHRSAALVRAGLAGLAWCAAYLAVVVLRPSALGMGDCKLAAVLGGALGWFGWAAVFAAVVITHLVAGGYALARLGLRRTGRADPVAFGPFMLVGGLAAVILAA